MAVSPTWETVYSRTAGAYVLCSCGAILQTIQRVREHWQAGHFDYEHATAKRHAHDLAFLDGGEGVYCMDVDCDFRLEGDELLRYINEKE
jgi:hypothetical protein